MPPPGAPEVESNKKRVAIILITVSTVVILSVFCVIWLFQSLNSAPVIINTDDSTEIEVGESMILPQKDPDFFVKIEGGCIVNPSVINTQMGMKIVIENIDTVVHGLFIKDEEFPSIAVLPGHIEVFLVNNLFDDPGDYEFRCDTSEIGAEQGVFHVSE